MSKTWTPQEWEDYFAKNPQASANANKSSSNKKSVKSKLKTKLEDDQLNLIYNKINNNEPMTHQDSSIVAQHFPTMPGFEHLKPEADLKSKGRLRFDQLVTKTKNGTATKLDYWEIGNNTMYDWNVDDLGLKNNEHTKDHPKNPDKIKADADFKRDETDRIAGEKKIKQNKNKVDGFKIKRENIKNKMEPIYVEVVENPLKELEALETRQGWVTGLGNLYIVTVSNEGLVSVKFNQPEISILLESDTYKALSDEGKKKAKKIYGENNHLIRTKISEINKNLYKYNSLKKSLNTVNSSLLDMGILD